MRTLFILLVVLNSAFFAWMFFKSSVAQPPEASLQYMQAPENALPIILLREAVDLQPVRQKRQQQTLTQKSEVLVGGFMDETRIRALQQRLLTLNIGGEIVERTRDISKEYMVYVPPYPSLRLAMRQLRELENRKIDAYIIEEGELQYGISVGVYGQELAASSQLERMRRAHYQAEIKEIVRSQRAYWIKIADAGLRLIDQDVIDRLRQDFNDLLYLPEAEN